MVDINPMSENIEEFQETDRPPSEQLVELHLYLVPKEKWLEKRKLARNQAVDHTISVGFVRVLPQTVLSDLRKEMDRQLGIESVPQTYVFLRSVGRNFAQVRPKQEMEMKVKNYVPPLAPEPELYLKEGNYTGPSTWSQGEDSGVEESLTDSNSQRSHDRATPESPTDDPLVLPALTDFLGLPTDGGRSESGRMPPGAVTMSAEDLSAVPSYAHRKRFGGSSEDVRLRRLKERPENRRPEAERRAESWNRRQKRGASKERGGTQLPTWAETRTTRLRRSRALGETTAQQQQQQKPKRNGVGGAAKPEKAQQPKRNIRPPPPQHVDAEDEEEEEEEDDAGRVLMERIRANSRCLKAQLSSHRRTVSDTGSANHETRQPVRPPNNTKASHGNGVYAMHRRTAGGSSGGDSGGAEVESTSIRLLDENGEEVVTTTSSAASSSSPAAESPLASSAGEPEVVHQHVLEVDGEDGNKQHGDHDGLSNISEKTGRETPTDKADSPVSSNDLEEGRLVNQNGQLTIEVEVKEMTSSDGGDTTLESNITPEFDSYRVYSDQNILRQSEDTPVDDSAAPPRASRADVASRNEAARLNRAKQARGVYLRRMEHRNSQAGRTQSNDRVGQSPARRVGGRSVSQNRSGRARMEKWSTTAQSTGDLREAAWDYSNDQDRLLTILSEVRGETRIRQRQREELLRKIKQLQSRAHQRREQVREMWRKRYLEAKKVTPRLEEECSRLRQELEKLHRELLAKVQAGVWALLTISGKTERPSNKLSYKIMIARLLQEIEDLTRRVEGTRLKLHTEVKLRSMAEKDVRNLREELLKKKIQVTLTRNQEQAAMGNGLRQQYFISAM